MAPVRRSAAALAAAALVLTRVTAQTAVTSATLNFGVVGGENCLNFAELWVFNNDGQLVSVRNAPGTTVTATTQMWGGTVAGGSDFTLGVPSAGFVNNPFAALGANSYHGDCVATSFYTVAFPSQLISQYMLISRQDGSIQRVLANGYRVQLRNGATVTETVAVGSNASVVVKNFTAPMNPPILPDPTSAAQLASRVIGVRYVRITSGAPQFLNFREIMVFDVTNTNVARGKRCYSSVSCLNAATCCEKAVDHIIEQDFRYDLGNIYHAGVTTTGSWVEFDLGGVYNVSNIIIFNYWYSQNNAAGGGPTAGNSTGGLVGRRMQGAVVSIRNHYNDTLGSYTLSAAGPMYRITPVLPVGSPTQSVTPVSSTTASTTSSPSATLSTGAQPSVTATASPIPLAVPVTVRVRTTGGNFLTFTELIAVSTTGTLLNVGASAVAQSTVWSNMAPSVASDFCWNAWSIGACPPFIAGTFDATTWSSTWATPADVATVYFINRVGSPNASRITQAQTAFVEVVNQDGSVNASFPITSTQSISTFSLAATRTPIMPDLTSPFHSSAVNRASLVRYVRIGPCPSFLHFREFMVFDDTNTNVALNKPVTSSPQYQGDPTPYFPRLGNNGVIDMDTGSDMTHSLDVGGVWQVDLGGMFNVRKIAMFNRLGNVARMAGTNVSFLNFDNATVGLVTLTAGELQVVDVALFAPSATPTTTGTPTGTATNTGTPTTTGTPTGTTTSSPSTTASPSGTLSSGAVPSDTATSSSTASGTPSSPPTVSSTASVTGSPSGTSSITGSPLSALPNRLRISVTGGACLNFVEAFAISPAGRIVSAGVLGATTVMSSVLDAGRTGVRGVDLFADPLQRGGTALAHSQCSGASVASLSGEFWEATFYPSAVAQAIFVNRGDGTFMNRIFAGAGVMTVTTQTGATAGSLSLDVSLVQPLTLAPYDAPVSPAQLAPDQLDANNRYTGVRWVRVLVPAGASLSFRELWVLDSTLNNVARGKSAVVADAGSGASTASAGVDMTLDFDSGSATAGSRVAINGTGVTTPSWTVDLGGLYMDVSYLVFWSNRYALPPAGCRIELVNFYGSVVGNFSLTANGLVQTFNASGLVYLPTPTPTTTASPSSTTTPTVTPTSSLTATLSVGAEPSISGTPTPTSTSTVTPMSVHPASVVVQAVGQCLNLLEVLVFNTAGRLISSSASGATASLSSTYLTAVASFGNDMCLSMGVSGALLNGCQLAHSNCDAGLNTFTIRWAPQLPAFPNGLPQPVGSVYFINRQDGGLGTRITLGGGNMTLNRVDGSVITTRVLGSTVVTQLQVNPITLPTVPLDDAPEDSKQRLVRYVNLQVLAAQFLNFKELMVFDDTGTNVALNKPTTGTPQYVGDPSTYTLAAGNNGIIDTDVVPMDLVHASVIGGSWRVDLQGMYNVTRVILFNRGGLSSANMARMSGATMTFSNYYNFAVGSLTMTGDYIQAPFVTLFPPTPTPTPTTTGTGTGTSTGSASPSQTASASGTGTGSPSGTGTATLSFGTTPSITGSPTGTPPSTSSDTPTPSVTASASSTATSTSSLTQSPFSLFPTVVRIDIGYGACLNFYELFAVSTTGRIVSASLAGGVATASSLYGSSLQTNAIDLLADPLGGQGQLMHANCLATDWWQVDFPPAQLARVIFVNRADGGWATRLTAGGGVITARAQTGTTLLSNIMSAGFVQEWALASYAAPSSPSAAAADQVDEALRATGVRYVRLTAPEGSSFGFRELWALDSSLTNVAQGKAAVLTGATTSATRAAMGTDGLLEYDVTSADSNGVVLNGTGGVAPSWTVDLGGLYHDLTRVVMFVNRFALPPIGCRLTLLNHYGATVGQYSLSTTLRVATINVTAGRFPATPSSTPSVSPTSSPSSTLSVGSVPSNTPSNLPTPTVTPSPVSPFPASVRIVERGQFLNFLELLVFNTAGRLISLASGGATATSSSLISSAVPATAGIDFCLGMGVSGAVLDGCSLMHTDISPLESFQLTFAPQLPTYPNGLPQPVGSVYFINRQDGGLGARITLGGGNMSLHQADGVLIASQPLLSTVVTQWQVNPITLPTVPLDDAPEDSKQRLVRYVNLQIAAGQFLHFKELMVFDDTGTNVALNKPVTGTPQYIGDPSTYYLAAGNNGIIDADVVPLDLVHAAVVSGFWRVDLQGMYNVTRVILFNRGGLSSANMARLSGATMTFSNYYNYAVGSLTMTGDYIQAPYVTLFPPTPTPTQTSSSSVTSSPSQTPSPSQTASASGTGTGSPSGTGTATLSFGTTPSITGSPTGTPPNTPSASITGSVTASPSSTASSTSSITGSPLSVFPNRLRIDISGGQCLNFYEAFAVSTTGRIVSASLAGGVASMSSTFANTAAANNGNDLFLDPYGGGGSLLAHANCQPTDWWQVDFPPAQLARVVFVNRADSGLSTRITTGNGVISVRAQTGTSLLSESLGPTFIQEFTMSPYAAPTLPDAAAYDQVDATNRSLRVRFVRVQSGDGSSVSIRELWALDASALNVARGKSCSASHAMVTGATANAAVDGVLDFDNNLAGNSRAYVDLQQVAPGEPVWWQVDLGGLYDLANVVLFLDRYNMVSTPATVVLANWNGDQIGSVAVPVGLRVFSFNMTGRLSAPAPTGSGTQTITPTRTASRTPSASITASSTGTQTGTSTPTATESFYERTPTQTGTPTQTATSSPTSSFTAASTASTTKTGTPAATASATSTASATTSGTPTASATASVTASPTGTPASTQTSSVTATASSTSSVSATPTGSETSTASSTGTAAETGTATASGTAAETGTTTASGTAAETVTGTATPTGTGSGSSSGTGTSSSSATETATSAVTSSPVPTTSPTAAATATGTAAVTGTPAATKSKTAPPTKTRTATKTRTRTATKTKTKTRTKTRTPSKKKKLME